MNDRDLALDAIAAYRLTRLLSADVILEGSRARVIRAAYEWRAGGTLPSQSPREWEARAEADDEAPKLATLVLCRYCVGVYAGFAVLAARRFAPRQWEWAARGLALSAAAALIAGLER